MRLIHSSKLSVLSSLRPDFRPHVTKPHTFNSVKLILELTVFFFSFPVSFSRFGLRVSCSCLLEGARLEYYVNAFLSSVFLMFFYEIFTLCKSSNIGWCLLFIVRCYIAFLLCQASAASYCSYNKCRNEFSQITKAACRIQHTASEVKKIYNTLRTCSKRYGCICG